MKRPVLEVRTGQNRHRKGCVRRVDSRTMRASAVSERPLHHNPGGADDREGLPKRHRRRRYVLYAVPSAPMATSGWAAWTLGALRAVFRAPSDQCSEARFANLRRPLNAAYASPSVTVAP
jgi:hypothetical protein